MTSVERTYHPNGKLASEVHLADGLPHGVTRRWHPNGTLASEIPMTRGVTEGVARQWNEQGTLLGTYEIRNGNGIIRTWHENGQIMSETPMTGGALTGCQRSFFDDGTLAAETFWLRNKKVSKRRYLQEARSDPDIPAYVHSTVRSSESQLRRTSNAQPGEERSSSRDDLPRSILAQRNTREALQWLAEDARPLRSLGEAGDPQESIRLVRELYALGAVKVHVVGIDGDSDKDQTSSKLILELPSEPFLRSRLFDRCGRIALETGYQPEADVGQRLMLLMLD